MVESRTAEALDRAAATGPARRSGAVEGAAIRTFGLGKRFGPIEAVRDLTIEIPYQAVAGFVGPNGSGKTTTIRMLLGLVTPSAGSAEVLGAPLSRRQSYLPKVGALIEAPAFYPTLSGRRNLEILASLGEIDRRRIGYVLEVVGLAERAGDKVGRYSLGMKQRLGIAAALLPDPPLLILDEPANGLDPAGILEMRRLIGTLREEGRTIFVSSHILSEIEQVATWLLVLKSGRLVFHGPMDEALRLRGGELVVATERAEDLETLLRLAAGRGHEGTVREGRAHISAPPEFAGELNRIAMRSGVTIVEIHPSRANLEEAFLSMTEGGN